MEYIFQNINTKENRTFKHDVNIPIAPNDITSEGYRIFNAGDLTLRNWMYKYIKEYKLVELKYNFSKRVYNFSEKNKKRLKPINDCLEDFVRWVEINNKTRERLESRGDKKSFVEFVYNLPIK